MHINNTALQNDLSLQQIDSALLRLAALLKDEQPKQEKQKFNKQVHVGISQDDSESITSTLPNNNIQNKLTPQQVNQLVGRMYDKHQQTQEKIQKMRQDHQPQSFILNDVSQKIIKKKIENGEYQPLYERAKFIHLEKQEKIRVNERLKTQEELMTIKIKCSETKSIDRFLEKIDYWQSQKNQSLQSQQQEKLERELEGVTFHPIINKQSQKIAQQLSLDTHFLERFSKSEINKHKKELQLLNQELEKMPFKPTINRKSQFISANSRYQQNNYIKSYNYFREPSQHKSQQSVKNASEFREYQKNNTRVNYFEYKQSTISLDQSTTKLSSTKSLTPNKFQKQNLNKNNHGFEKSPTPLRNNRTITNIQEIKYNSDLKFLVTLATQSKDRKPLF